MEPFLSRNGQTLLFNNRNDPSVNTDLHLATRVDSLTFRSLGRLASANTADLVLARRTSGGFERHSDSDVLLQNVNTDAALEYAAAISSDGRELFFNRVEAIDGVASPAIYRAARPSLDAPFGIPQRVAAMTGFVEDATFGPDDRAVYYYKRENNRFVLYRVSRQSRSLSE